MKVISFCLWGDNPKYNVGAIRNAELAKQIYPDWLCSFYVGSTVPIIILEQLARINNTHIVMMSDSGDWRSMFWRFEPASNPEVECMISRDCDSRLSMREKEAVDEWLVSDKGFHIMRDHPWHGSKILGGMFGVKRGVLPDIIELMRNWNQEDRWQTDQDFLNTVIYPRVVNNSIVHDPFFDRQPFPSSRSELEFVGEVYDENECINSEHREVLRRWLKGRGEVVRIPKELL